MARREERAYREYVSDEQRSQPGCPARELCDESLLRDTRERAQKPRATQKPRSPQRKVFWVFLRVLRVLRSTSYFFTDSLAERDPPALARSFSRARPTSGARRLQPSDSIAVTDILRPE